MFKRLKKFKNEISMLATGLILLIYLIFLSLPFALVPYAGLFLYIGISFLVMALVAKRSKSRLAFSIIVVVTLLLYMLISHFFYKSCIGSLYPYHDGHEGVGCDMFLLINIISAFFNSIIFIITLILFNTIRSLKYIR